MKLFQEILAKILVNEEIVVTFPNLKLSAVENVELASFLALQGIKAVIENDSLDDYDCIDEIVCIFERMGSGGGSRHDF